MFRQMLLPGRVGEEQLDQPLSNFDVIGIPTGSWSSGFFACHENCLPSCIVSFFCPCIMWSQIVVRSQIPLLIGIKNSLACLRPYSGYHYFVDFFFWSLVIGIVCIFIISIVSLPRIVQMILGILAAILLLALMYIVSHTRTAFREKLVADHPTK
jgi:hypothetical protein